jgi:DNA repair exonuclease SbcCD ATPase subunit
MDMVKINRMQRALDELSATRAELIRRYDRSRDGTEEKQNAREGLNRVGAEIVKLENLIDAAVD